MSENALQKILAIEKDARDFGFDWPNIDMIIDQTISECEEIRDAVNNNEPKHRLHEEIGDLIHTAISLCYFAGFDTEETLLKASKKFTARMDALKVIAKQRGLDNLKGQDINFMLELWKSAKEMTDHEQAYK